MKGEIMSDTIDSGSLLARAGDLMDLALKAGARKQAPGIDRV